MTVAIVMTTYIPEGGGSIRAEYAKRCLRALWSHLRASEPISLILTDDDSPDQDAFARLIDVANEYYDLRYISQYHNGIGHSLNSAVDILDDALWMYTTDDWLLTETLDLDCAVKLIRQYKYDIVRLGPIHPNLKCTTKFDANVGWWLDIDNTYGFAFATRPFLAAPNLLNKFGRFTEGCNAYETERLYAEQLTRTNCKIAQIGSISLSGPWEHIGEFPVGINAINNS